MKKTLEVAGRIVLTGAVIYFLPEATALLTDTSSDMLIKVVSSSLLAMIGATYVESSYASER